MSDTVTLIPINPRDQSLMGMMTPPSSPRWMRLAACLALEGRRVVLVRDGLLLPAKCPICAASPIELRALHKNAFGGDPRALLSCPACRNTQEAFPLITLERDHPSEMKGLRDAF